MKRHLVTAALFIVLLAIAGALFYSRNYPPPETIPVDVKETTVPGEKQTESEPTHPLPEPNLADKTAALETPPPSGNETPREILLRLFAGLHPEDIFITDAFIERFVIMIDNLPRKKLPLSHLPVRPVPGTFLVTTDEGTTTISPENAKRYLPYVRLLEGLDTKKGVDAYLRNYPLFQKAYREMGYKRGYFNDSLMDVIDHLIAAPVSSESPSLTPHVNRYRYTDLEIEALSAGQKIMVRIGSDNASIIKRKLKEIRKELTSGIVKK